MINKRRPRAKNSLYFIILLFSTISIIFYVFLYLLCGYNLFQAPYLSIYCLLGFILGTTMAFYQIRHYRKQIQGNEYHFIYTPTKMGKRLIDSIVGGCVVGGIGISIKIIMTKFLGDSWVTEIANSLMIFITITCSLMMVISTIITLVWLIHYEKQHGSVYEVNDSYAEKSPTIPAP